MIIRVGFLLALILSMAMSALAASPWVLADWQYRMPIQVQNRSDKNVEGSIVILEYFPALLLMNEGKLAAGAQDLRLVDEQGKVTSALALQYADSDLGDAGLIFVTENIPAHERRLYWLYYGNPKATPGPKLTADPQLLAKDIRVSLGAEENVKPAPVVKEATFERWLKKSGFTEAESLTGQGFAPQQISGEQAALTCGSAVLAASGGASDKVTVEFNINDGRYICWVRCLPTVPGKPAQGNLVLSLEYKDLAPVVRIEQCKPADSPYRWVPLSIVSPFRGKLRLTAEAKSSFAALDCIVLTQDPQYRPDYRDFLGRVWVRWRIDMPVDYRYSAKVHNEINPYAPKYQLTGMVSPYGLQADLDSLPFKEDGDYFAAGQYSPWVLLPTSTAAQWHSVLFFPPKPGGKLSDDMTVRLEFANRPSANHIFHITPSEPVEKGSASLGVRMPTKTTLGGLQQLETFNEWAQRRYEMVEKLHLGPPPHLARLKVGTWEMMNTRLGGGTVSRQAADIAYRGLEAIGVNFPSISGVDDALAGEMMQQHGMIGTTWTAWAGSWYYTREGYDGQYNFKGDETPQQRWQRVFDDFYGKSAATAKKNNPNLFASAPHINLGDEIGQATSAEEIAKTPQILAYFRTWLQQRGLAPADFNEDSWEKVLPLDDRKQINGQEGTPKVRRYYWTWQFINEYTAIFYRAATAAAKRNYTNGQLYAVNYQAGPMQFAYIGNNNDTDRGMMDIFHLNRTGAFQGVMMEDWVSGWDVGIGRDCLGAEIMRAAARKQNLPMASYLVGGEAIRAEFIAFLMHGIKENDLYLYGPITNIGPAWGESPKALAETAEVTRQVKKFENAIADGTVRPRNAAMLIAVTSDTMQKKGLYFCQERQDLYITLKHDGLPVDVICEQDIVDDDLLKQYDVLYVCDPQVRDDVQRKIADWVKAGGKLWASAGALQWNEYHQPSAVLNDVFGVGKREMVTQENWVPWTAGSWAATATKANYQQLGTLKATAPLFGGEISLPVWGTKMDFAPTTAQTLGSYDDGKPAVLLNSYGKGQALLVGALVGEAYIRQHYPANLPCGKEGWSFDLGTPARKLVCGIADTVKRPLTLSLPGIYTSVMDCPQGTLVFLNNATLATETDFTKALKPTVTIRVPMTFPVKGVESSNTGALKYTVQNGEVTFTLSLPNTDIVLIKK